MMTFEEEKNNNLEQQEATPEEVGVEVVLMIGENDIVIHQNIEIRDHGQE